VYSLEGEVDNLMRLLSFHPEFLKEFVTFYNYLMYGQHLSGGAISFDMRHFIAILASARHKCTYLVAQQEREFLLQNGQKSWLHGVDFIPPKLKDLHELNKLLCHQPWLVNQNHIHV
jgi:sestrin